MIGDDMDKAVTDIVSMMLTMARLNGGEIKPIGVMLGDKPFMLKLEPVEQVVHTMPDTEIKGTNGKPAEEAEPTDF